MSWSVAAVGKSDAVKKKLAVDFEGILKYVKGPEIEAVKGAQACIEVALDAQVPPAVVKVAAGGSQQSEQGQTGAPSKYVNSVKIDIEPVWGFVE